MKSDLVMRLRNVKLGVSTAGTPPPPPGFIISCGYTPDVHVKTLNGALNNQHSGVHFHGARNESFGIWVDAWSFVRNMA